MNALVEKMIRDNLEIMPDECPKCGVSYKCLEDSLHEGVNSENYHIARTVMANCDVCAIRFKEAQC